MAQIKLSAHETDRIEAVTRDLEASLLDYLGDVREALSPEGWDVLQSYARARLRRCLEVSVHLHAVVDAQGATAVPYPGRGRDSFVRASLAAWRDSFAPIADAWRLALVFEQIAGGEQRVMADLAALELIAVDRMFQSFDREYAAFLSDEGPRD